MKKVWSMVCLAVAAIGVAACEPPSSEGLVAKMGDYELTVDQVTRLLVDEERLAANVSIVHSLVDLWMDYTLLAEAVARDSTFSSLDLEPLVREQLAQVMVFQLRDSVIQIDTFITDDELRALYEAETPAVEVRARHIMLQYPFQATAVQRDSVRAQLEAVRQRILGGANFETVARQVSQDPGSAPSGGDLGFFRRGEMVAPFEQAALALDPGQMSGVVETPMGLHLIRLDERRVQGFEQGAREFRFEVQGRRVAEAESTFVAGLIAVAAPRLAEGAAAVTRELAADPSERLTRRAARRPLLQWSGGEVTVGEVQELLRVEVPGLRGQIAQGTDEEVNEFIEGLGRRELLVREAQAAGLQPPPPRVDSLVADAATQLRRAARSLGLFNLDRAPGEALPVAITRAVEAALGGNLSGATQVVPLGLVGFQLRAGRPTAVYEAGVGQALLRIAQQRSGRGPSAIEQSRDSAATAPPPGGR